VFFLFEPGHPGTNQLAQFVDGLIFDGVDGRGSVSLDLQKPDVFENR
jgi:hypothetical protein